MDRVVQLEVIEIDLTLANAHTVFRPGDVIVEAPELGQVVSARPDVRDEWILVYFMGGDCYKEQFGPQKLEVLRRVGEPEYEWSGRPIGTHVQVDISKIGGGTVGRRYRGTWSYRATQNNKVVAEGDDLNIAKCVTHEEAARIAWSFLDSEYAWAHEDD